MTFVRATDVRWENLEWGDLGWVVHPAVAPEATGLTVLDVVLQPGKGHDFHRHPSQQEVIYVASGTIEQWVEQERTILGPGDAAFIPTGAVHATFVAQDAAEPAHLVVSLGPSSGATGYDTLDMSGEAPWSTVRT